MEKPNYVEAKIRGDPLRTTDQRYERWVAMASAFCTCLEQKTKRTDWGIHEMGYPSIEHFDLLEHRDLDGDCWFVKIRHRGQDRWLLWFGFRSEAAVDLIGGTRCWPSIFIAERADRPDAIHPFDTDFERERLSEVIISPGASKPMILRSGYDTASVQIAGGAAILVRELCR